MPISFEQVTAEIAPDRAPAGEAAATPERAPAAPDAAQLQEQIEQQLRLREQRLHRLHAD